MCDQLEAIHARQGKVGDDYGGGSGARHLEGLDAGTGFQDFEGPSQELRVHLPVSA